MKSNIFSVVGYLIVFQTQAQTTVTLQCSRDAAIGFHDGANTAGNNYGTASQNAAFYIPSVATTPGSNGNRALIDFNLSSLGQVAVTGASLNLHALGPNGSLPGHVGNANACYLRRINQSWQDNIVTWNNQPTSSTVNQLTLPQSTSATQDYLNINVTVLIHDMMAQPSSSFGFMLRLVNEVSTNGLVFASKDHANPALWPTLVVTYTSSSTGIIDNGPMPALTLWPVPAVDQLQFEFKGHNADWIEIIDGQGRVVVSRQLPGTSLDISELCEGLYLLRCSATDGLIVQRRFIHLSPP